MKIARALFLASYRIPHACLSLQFDHYLENIDTTYIFTNCDPSWLDIILSKYVKTDNFHYVHDSEMDALYPSIRPNWFFADDYRGSWLYQQALKLASVDYIDADCVLIQDPDTFSIVPYNCFDSDKLKYFVIPNETHSYGYYKVLDSLGIARQTPHCFVTEFTPMLKEDWSSMKHTLNNRNNCDAFTAIINAVPVEDGLRWFSEYEFIGNWAMANREINLLEQKRFQYKTLDELDNLTRDYNCVCDAIPNLKDSMQFDRLTQTVKDFDIIFDKVKKFL